MEPIIRNIKDFAAGSPARLISADDNPALVTLAYSVIEPGGASAHHIHEWEHEVYIIEGSGTLVAMERNIPSKPATRCSSRPWSITSPATMVTRTFAALR